jgi:PEP-CTERM motif
VALNNGEVYAAAELTPGGPSFGVGGFGAESDGSDTSFTYDATMDFTFLTTTTGNVYLNLTSGAPSGDSFQSLVFTYSVDGSTSVVEMFTTVAAADAYFDGNAINLGDLTAGTQTLDLSYAFTAMGDAPGYVVTSSAPVPEPSTWTMLLLGYAGLGYAGWRRTRKPSLP